MFSSFSSAGGFGRCPLPLSFPNAPVEALLKGGLERGPPPRTANWFNYWFFKDFFKGCFNWSLFGYFKSLEWSFNCWLFLGCFGLGNCFCWSFNCWSFLDCDGWLLDWSCFRYAGFCRGFRLGLLIG